MANQFPALYQLGIVGAGQIARMMHQASVRYGITPHLLAEDITDSAAMAAPDASFGHPDSVAAFAAACGVVTFEHDRIDLGLIESLARDGYKIRPGPRTLRAAQDKAFQRRILTNRGFPVPAFAESRSPDDLFQFASIFGWPVVLKSKRAGTPDQNDVWIVENRTEALRVLSEQAGRQMVMESFQKIVKELTILVARRPGGNSRCYPLIEQINENGVAKEFRSPAQVSHQIATEARSLALKVAEELDSCGILAIELFLTTDGLVINEVAARPHNAGHLTIEASATSQFENHVRAVLDLPLGPTWMRCAAASSVNVFGAPNQVNPADNLADALSIEGVHVHLYGKLPRPGHKLGHVTAVANDIELASEMARRAEAALCGRRSW